MRLRPRQQTLRDAERLAAEAREAEEQAKASASALESPGQGFVEDVAALIGEDEIDLTAEDTTDSKCRQHQHQHQHRRRGDGPAAPDLSPRPCEPRTHRAPEELTQGGVRDEASPGPHCRSPCSCWCRRRRSLRRCGRPARRRARPRRALLADTAGVDVWVDGARATQNVGYDTVSEYVPLASGEHQFALRPFGASSTSKPILSASAALAPDLAYTIAGVGLNKSYTVRSIRTEPRRPAAGSAKVRVIDAAVGPSPSTWC